MCFVGVLRDELAFFECGVEQGFRWGRIVEFGRVWLIVDEHFEFLEHFLVVEDCGG